MRLETILRDRRTWIGLAFIALLIALQASGLADHLSLQSLALHREALSAFVGANYLLAAAAYVGLYIVAVASR